MTRVFLVVVLSTMAVVGGFAVARAAAPSPPGQNPCSHGNSGKPCRPDPQPEHGQDCLPHGNHGGENEDHCEGSTATEPTTTTPTTTTPTTPTTPTTTTTTTAPSPTGTTPTTPNPTTPASTVPGSTTTAPVASPTPGETVKTTTATETGPYPFQPRTKPKPRVKKPRVWTSSTRYRAQTGVPQKPSPGKHCPSGTRLFEGRCHSIIQGSG